jgi:1,4-alpha-glucan branching enzyme
VDHTNSIVEVKAVDRGQAKFVVVLHSHLPWVVGHGRWPFGEEWIYEIAWSSYLPLLRCIRNLARDGIPANLAVSLTPVLAEQLASEAFRNGFPAYLKDRRQRVVEDRSEFLAKGQTELARLASWMEEQLQAAVEAFDAIGRDIPMAFADHARAGSIELMTSAATHGYLPLLRREKSVRLQVRVGRTIFMDATGISPVGFWLPECAYKPGLEALVAGEGYRYTVLDAMAIRGGKAVSHYGESTRVGKETGRPVEAVYLIDESSLIAFPRHPGLCSQVWSKWSGYPGDFAYREFHRQHPRSGMRYYRVTDSQGKLETKQPYKPETAFARAREHAAHFVSKVERAADEAKTVFPVLATAFDTELYGHWWFEGPAFLEEVVRLLARSDSVQLSTPSRVLEATDPESLERVVPAESSWGVDCNHSTWLNDQTMPMWDKLWEIEEIVDQSWVLTPFGPWPGDLWNLQVLVDGVLREFLMLMASDWEFLVYTGTAGDYPWQRFEHHRREFARIYQNLRDALCGRGLPEYRYSPLSNGKGGAQLE